MKFIRWWKNTDVDESLQGIEFRLQQNLTPVVPRQAFIDDLRKSLLNQIPQEVEIAFTTQRKNLQTGLVVTGGILGGILIILSGMRGLISVIGMFALLINWLRQNTQHTTPAR